MSAAAAWEALVRAALLGTERQPEPVDAATGDAMLDGALAALADRPAEARVLETAALLDGWTRAGQRAPRTSAQPPAPAPDAAVRPCPAEALRVLKIILAGGPAAVLAEWLALAERAGAGIPHDLLPQVLDFARRHPDVRQAVAGALGPRGLWLAALNPEWSFAAAPLEHPATAWETGSFEERLATVRELRAIDPPAALALIQSTWAADPSRERAKFVEALEAGLGMDDEPFLEAALDDKRKEVRTTAARLLGTLPASRYVRRMTERLLPRVVLRAPEGLISRIRGAAPTIEVEPPRECDREMQRDGIDPRSAPHGMGEQVWWMRQMLAAVPPSVWTAHWGRPAAELLAAAQASDDTHLLVTAWMDAAVRTRDAEWAEAYLRTAKRQEAFGSVEAVAAVLPPERLEPLAVERIRAEGLKSGHSGAQMVQAARFAWSPALTRAVLQAFPTALSPSDWYPRDLLRVTAPYMHPAASVATLRELGDPHEGPWVDLIHLRHTLHQAFP